MMIRKCVICGIEFASSYGTNVCSERCKEMRRKQREWGYTDKKRAEKAAAKGEDAKAIPRFYVPESVLGVEVENSSKGNKPETCMWCKHRNEPKCGRPGTMMTSSSGCIFIKVPDQRCSR